MDHDGKPIDDDRERAGSLTEQAARCRRLACAIYNREISNILTSMADEYESAASPCAANDR